MTNRPKAVNVTQVFPPNRPSALRDAAFVWIVASLDYTQAPRSPQFCFEFERSARLLVTSVMDALLPWCLGVPRMTHGEFP